MFQSFSLIYLFIISRNLFITITLIHYFYFFFLALLLFIFVTLPYLFISFLLMLSSFDQTPFIFSPQLFFSFQIHLIPALYQTFFYHILRLLFIKLILTFFILFIFHVEVFFILSHAITYPPLITFLIFLIVFYLQFMDFAK